MPLLFGRYPAIPDDATAAVDKAKYGMFLMLLFRPWRHLEDVLPAFFGARHSADSDDAIWSSVYDEFLEWRRRIDASAKAAEEARRSLSPNASSTAGEAPFASAEWWDCLIHEKLRNYDVMKSRHKPEMTPSDCSVLPPLSSAGES